MNLLKLHFLFIFMFLGWEISSTDLVARCAEMLEFLVDMVIFGCFLESLDQNLSCFLRSAGDLRSCDPCRILRGFLNFQFLRSRDPCRILRGFLNFQFSNGFFLNSVVGGLDLVFSGELSTTIMNFNCILFIVCHYLV